MQKNHKMPMGRLLLDRFRWFDESLLASLKHEGWPILSHSDSIAMAYLSEGDVRISELARRLGVSRQSAQKSIVALEKAGLVRTDIDPTNVSARLVTLTAKGQRAVETALQVFSRLEERLSERLGADAVKQLRSTLQQDWGQPIVIE